MVPVLCINCRPFHGVLYYESMYVPEIVQHFPYLGLFLLLILGGIGFPFPEDTTLILCGFLISHDVIKLLPSFVVVYAGLLITDFFLYSAGKKYGRSVISTKIFGKFISLERISALEAKFRKRGIIVILLGRHLVGLRAQIFIVAGIMRMPALKFLITDAVTAIFSIALMVGAGYAGGYSLEIIKKDMTHIGHMAIFLFVVSLVVYLFVRRIRAGRK